MNRNLTADSTDKTPLTPRELQSFTIDMLRFPLIALVVFVHAENHYESVVDADFALFSAQGISNIVQCAISGVLGRVAVPAFFFISGFLFFLNMRHFSWEGYRKKMKSRVSSLLVPYVIWNILPFLSILIIQFLRNIATGGDMANVREHLDIDYLRFFIDLSEWETDFQGWFGNPTPMSGPYNLYLWFVRDLIVMSVLTPAIYLFVTRLKKWGILLLVCAYVPRLWYFIPGLHIESLLFFTLGAYLSVNGFNMVEVARKYVKYAVPVAVVTFVGATAYGGKFAFVGQNFLQFFILSSLVVVIYLASRLIERYNLRPNRFLVASCMFVYVVHAVKFAPKYSVLKFSKLIVSSIIPNNGRMSELGSFLLGPVVAIAFLLAVFALLRRFAPRVASVLSGNK